MSATLFIGVGVAVAFAFTMREMGDMIRVTLFGSRNNAVDGAAPAFDPAKDITSLAGKVVLITGGAGGLGFQTVIELARYGRPARIYIADLPRDAEAQQDVLQKAEHEAYEKETKGVDDPQTEFRFLDLDLASFESVRQCAASFASQEKRLDILFLNAGVIRVPPLTTAEGYEIHFGVNYLGHALLSRLLLPTLHQTAQQQSEADVRVVVLSSEGHVMAPKQGIDLDKVKTDCSSMHYAKRYGQSKVAQICLMKQLAKSHPELKVVAIHPGRILTGLAASLQKESLLARLTRPIGPLFCVPVTEGIRNHLWAATSPRVVSGTYYEPVGVKGTTSEAARNDDLAERLRVWTDEALAAIPPL